jgi:hypothetical protein
VHNATKVAQATIWIRCSNNERAEEVKVPCDPRLRWKTWGRLRSPADAVPQILWNADLYWSGPAWPLTCVWRVQVGVALMKAIGEQRHEDVGGYRL